MIPLGNPPFCHELGTQKMLGQGKALERIQSQGQPYLQSPAKETEKPAREINSRTLAGLGQIRESREGTE